MSDVMEDRAAEFEHARLEIVWAQRAVLARDCTHNRDALETALTKMDAVLDMANGEPDCGA